MAKLGNLMRPSVIAVSVLLVGACGENAETEIVSPSSDAEAPYAAPVDPSANAVRTASDKLERAPTNTGADSADMISASVDSARDKVDNIVADPGNTLAASAKAVSSARDDDLKSPVEAETEFGALVGDADRGKRLYGQCLACHSLDEGRNLVGPSLYNIVGQRAGAVEGFRYSDANANADIIWTEDALFAFLEDPREYMPGNRMIFQGVPKEQDRADIVAYLKAQSE